MSAEAPEQDQGIPRQDLQLADWCVRFSLNVVSRNGTSTRLEPKVMQVLACLSDHAGKVVTKEQIIATVWPDAFVGDQVLTNAIWQLRQVFGESARDSRLIQTIPKIGYRLAATPTPVPEAAGGISRTGEDAAQPNTGTPPVGSRWLQWRWVIAAIVTVVLAVMAGAYLRFAPAQPTRQTNTHSTLVVLPFTNLSGDPGQEYFSDGMTEEMILQFGRLQPERLAVIARASSMTYKRSGKRIDQIAKELKADYVLEGSVRRDGNRVRVAAHLIEAQTQAQIWGEVYEQDWNDVLLLQSDIARSVAQQVKLRLTPEQDSRLASVRRGNQEAHEAYLKGRFYWNKRTREDLYTAVSYFEQAAQIDPGYALAYVGIADSYWALHEWGLLSTAQAAEKGRAAARKAIELDDSLGQSHAALGAAAMNYDWDWAGTEREFKLAIALSPNYADVHQWYAEYLSAMGRHSEAIAEIKRAQALDPYSLIINSVAGMLFFQAGRYDEAISECRKALEIDPDFHAAHYYLGKIYLEQGRSTEALAEFARTAKIFSRSARALRFDLAVRADMSARSGNRKEGLRLAEELSKGTPDSPSGYVDIAALYAALGEKDRAFQFLDKAIQERQRSLRLIRITGAFDSLRSDPRYREVLRRLNFPT